MYIISYVCLAAGTVESDFYHYNSDTVDVDVDDNNNNDKICSHSAMIFGLRFVE